MADQIPEHIVKLAQKIENDSEQATTPVPKMKIEKLYDIETGLGIGDVMVMLTMLPGLREKYPDWTIRLITEKTDWARLGHDYVAHPKDVEVEGTRGERYFKQFEKNWIDYDLDAIAAKKLRHELFGDLLGVVPRRFELRVHADVVTWARNIIDNKDNRKVVAIAPYASSEQRTWPDENWVCLLELLIEGGYMPIMLGGPNEGERSRYYPCVRYWGMGAQRTAALLKACNLVIGNDSGMTHVSALLDVPTVVLGAPTDTPRIFGWYGNVLCIQARSGCSLCYWRRDHKFRQECNYRCRVISALDPTTVFKEATKRL